MLKIVDSLAELDFAQLLAVCQESLCERGQLDYPNEPANLQQIYAEQDLYVYLEEFFREPAAKYALWVVDGFYVSVLRFEPYQNGLLVNALETLPTARKQGFAKILLSAVRDYLAGSGSGVLYSHTQKDNAASLRTHLACGFSIISDSAVYLDGSNRMDSFTLSLKY